MPNLTKSLMKHNKYFYKWLANQVQRILLTFILNQTYTEIAREERPWFFCVYRK
jgi:hypothetical protein